MTYSACLYIRSTSWLLPVRALKTVDELVQKIQFEGPSISISSKHLAVGISTLNASVFNGTSFSAFVAPNSTYPQVTTPHRSRPPEAGSPSHSPSSITSPSTPQIDFQSGRSNPLAQVSLPASLLSGTSLTEEERSSLSRINFMFFSSTNLFQVRSIKRLMSPDQ